LVAGFRPAWGLIVADTLGVRKTGLCENRVRNLDLRDESSKTRSVKGGPDQTEIHPPKVQIGLGETDNPIGKKDTIQKNGAH